MSRYTNLQKTVVMFILILICIGLICYLSLFRGVHIVYTHFFYLPITIAGIWWGKKSVWIAAALSVCLLSPYIIFSSNDFSPDELMRCLMFIAVALVVGNIGEENLKYEKRIKESEEKYRFVFENAPLGIFHFDKLGVITACNTVFSEMIGTLPETIIGIYIQGLPDKEVAASLEKALAGQNGHYEGDYKSIISGRTISMKIDFAPITSQDGSITGGVGIVENISERKQKEEEMNSLTQELFRINAELQNISVIDALTGLHNRRGFITYTERQLQIANRNKIGLHLIYVDIDYMKQINDTLGHHQGDAALVAAARVLNATFRQSDIIARIGGDEFAILAIEAEEKDYVHLISERIRKNLEAFNEKKELMFELSLSVGIAYYDPQNPCTLDELLLRGDALMYEEKKIKRLGQLKRY